MAKGPWDAGVHARAPGRVIDYFSRRTPLKGALSCLTSMMRPVAVSRFAQLPLGVWNCDRPRTAPDAATVLGRIGSYGSHPPFWCSSNENAVLT